MVLVLLELVLPLLLVMRREGGRRKEGRGQEKGLQPVVY
jgi:hypothetical protein